MHTQAESTRTHRRRAISPGEISGLTLYLLTLCVEAILGLPVRWLLAYLGATIVGAVFPLGLGAEQVAWLTALAPIAWSLMALVLPGRGWIWARRLGARRPSAAEAAALDDAFALLASADPGLADLPLCHVLDEPLPEAAVRGGALILSRALLEADPLAAILAHELGHAESLDGRLTEALDRLALWEDPLALPPAAREDSRGALTWALARWTLRLAGGSLPQRLLAPLWAAYWRSREYAADAYAASLGQAQDLACHLADQELVLDAPQPGLLFKASQHPPVALRIERLLASPELEGSR
jgi:Zn-dependent protease with chaperone function